MKSCDSTSAMAARVVRIRMPSGTSVRAMTGMRANFTSAQRKKLKLSEPLGPMPVGRQPAEFDRKDDDQDDAEPELRHADAENRDTGREAVDDAADAGRREDAQAERDDESQDDRDDRDRNGVGQRPLHLAQHRPVVLDRDAEIAGQRVPTQIRYWTGIGLSRP